MCRVYVKGSSGGDTWPGLKWERVEGREAMDMAVLLLEAGTV